QLAKEWAGENLRRIRRASSTSKDEELTARRGENVASHCNVLIDELKLSCGNLARCRCYVGFTHQTIRHSRRGIFLRIIFDVGLRETENLVHVWAAQVAVDEKDTVAPLGQCE